MSTLATRKSRLVFTTCDTVRSRGKLRDVVIEAHRFTCDVRLAGTRKRFPVSYAAIYDLAAKLEAEKQRAAKKSERKSRTR